MKIRNKIQIAMSVLLSIGLLITGLLVAAGTASASRQAVVKIEYSNTFVNIPYVYSHHVGLGLSNSKSATVGSTSMTPSIMFPAKIIDGTRMFTYMALATPSGYQNDYYYMFAGTLKKSRPGHVTGPPGAVSTLPTPLTVGGGTLTATTKCFKSQTTPFNFAYFTPTGFSFPNQCFPKGGTDLQRFQGPKKFGGTARLFRDRISDFRSVNATPIGGYNLIRNRQFFTTGLLDADTGFEYGQTRIGLRTPTLQSSVMRTQLVMVSQGPHTTGMAHVGGSLAPNGTDFTLTGSNSFNTANLTGMISMVKPGIRRTYFREPNGLGGFNFAGSDPRFTHVIRRVTLTFAGEVPEPGTLMLLGFGSIGLVGLARLRRS